MCNERAFHTKIRLEIDRENAVCHQLEFHHTACTCIPVEIKERQKTIKVHYLLSHLPLKQQSASNRRSPTQPCG